MEPRLSPIRQNFALYCGDFNCLRSQGCIRHVTDLITRSITKAIQRCEAGQCYAQSPRGQCLYRSNLLDRVPLLLGGSEKRLLPKADT